MRLSVVIPTLNEASCLGETIAVLRARTAGPPADVIVADCGSLDAMLAVATECGLGIKTAPSLTSRARACNAGAAAVKGDALIHQALASSDLVGGAFELRLDGPQWRLRLVELINRLRYRLRGQFFGDQGIFVRRRTFETIGGFSDVGILEDARFCARARQVGKMWLIAAEMLTSPRRFYEWGILRTLGFDALTLLTELMGLDSDWLAGVYRRSNIRRGAEVSGAVRAVSPARWRECPGARRGQHRSSPKADQSGADRSGAPAVLRPAAG
jgi:glycosyltransferase involved in cell wall biosynthesis